MPGRVVVQWDKDDCADMGIVKIDLLGLGMMAALQDALHHDQRAPARAARSRSRMWNHPARTTREVYDMLQAADTIGVFQVESRAQMATLPRLKPAHFYDLVVEVAIIRPGPDRRPDGAPVSRTGARAASRSSIRTRRSSRSSKRTLGVPLFQEQLLRMAMVAAGFTGGQAEELRRAMGFKRSEKRMKADRGAAARRAWRATGITGEAADDDRPVDHVVRALRFSRVALGELRADRLRERVPEGALPGGLLRGAAQQPADGVLSPGHAGEGRAAARRALRARRRAALGLGVRRSRRTARCAWGCGYVNGLREAGGAGDSGSGQARRRSQRRRRVRARSRQPEPTQRPSAQSRAPIPTVARSAAATIRR